MFHDVRWGAEHEGRFLWVLLNSGSCGAYAFNHDPDTLQGVHTYRQPSLYFPTPGGTFAGESLPGEMTWARAYIRDGVLWMDVGKGEVVKLPPEVRDAWWKGTTREWPFMAADMGIVTRHADGALPVEPRGRGLRRHLRRDGGAVAGAGLQGAHLGQSQARRRPGDRCAPSTWASTSAPAALRASFADGTRGRHGRRAPSEIFRPRGGLRRAVERRHLARVRHGRARRASRGRASAEAHRRHRLRRDLLAGGARRRRPPGHREPDRPTTRRTSSCGWITARWPRRRGINATRHEVLRYVGGTLISPEMETPKLAWLKENLPAVVGAGRALPRSRGLPLVPRDRQRRALALHHGVQVDLPRGTRPRWATTPGDGSATYLRAIGLGRSRGRGISPASATPIRPDGRARGRPHRDGGRASWGSPRARRSGLAIIDAHAGGLGMLGAPIDGVAPTPETLEERVALIGGTSSCHMAVSRQALFVSGMWGPYKRAMMPGLWLTEGGQSADGRAHRPHRRLPCSRGRAPGRGEGRAASRCTLAQRPSGRPREGPPLPRDADARSARLARSSRQSLAARRSHAAGHGERASSSVRYRRLPGAPLPGHGAGRRARDSPHPRCHERARLSHPDAPRVRAATPRNPVFLREHADVTGCRIVLPKPSRRRCSSAPPSWARWRPATSPACSAMARMNRRRLDDRAVPRRRRRAELHREEHHVFQRMHGDQLAYRAR